MGKRDLKLETSFSSSRGALPYIAIAGALVALAGIVVVMTTDVAARLLPMDPRYVNVLVPTVADGSPPLSLQTLTQKSDNKSLTVEGSVLNRTDSTISGLLAVVQVKDRYTLPGEIAQVPIEPAELESQVKGKFRATIMVGEKGLSGYDIQFKLPNDGPFVPHKDDHPLELTPQIKPTK